MSLVSNAVSTMRSCATGHQSNYQGKHQNLIYQQDIERRVQAALAKDGIRVSEFFIDFDKLRKGTVGEAAVSKLSYLQKCNVFNLCVQLFELVQNVSRHFEIEFECRRTFRVDRTLQKRKKQRSD